MPARGVCVLDFELLIFPFSNTAVYIIQLLYLAPYIGDRHRHRSITDARRNTAVVAANRAYHPTPIFSLSLCVSISIRIQVYSSSWGVHGAISRQQQHQSASAANYGCMK